jgi:hypothetical protein
MTDNHKIIGVCSECGRNLASGHTVHCSHHPGFKEHVSDNPYQKIHDEQGPEAALAEIRRNKQPTWAEETEAREYLLSLVEQAAAGVDRYVELIAALLACAEEYTQLSSDESDKYAAEFLKPISADAPHAGDCANMPFSCLRCERDEYHARARRLMGLEENK